MSTALQSRTAAVPTSTATPLPTTPAHSITLADRLVLHIVVGLILGTAFAMAQDNAAMVLVGLGLGALFGGSGVLWTRRH